MKFDLDAYVIGPVEWELSFLHYQVENSVKDGKLIGMGRLVGDGAMYWYLQEIIVLPEYQGLGIGTMIVEHLVDYAVKNSSTGKFTTIGGVSAKGKEGFYQKLGFDVISNGIQKMIEI